MNHDQSIEPLREQGDEAAELAIVTGTPESFGFPENPTVPESKRWAMQQAFLAKFSKTHLLCASADAAGISPQAVEQWRHEGTYGDKSSGTLNSFNFPKRFNMASLRYQETLDVEIDRRAVDGIDKPVYYKWEKVDTVKEYSDNLLMFRRKKLDPTYRDNYAPTVNPQGVKVTSITFNFHPDVVQPSASQPMTDAEYRELPAGDERSGDGKLNHGTT